MKSDLDTNLAHDLADLQEAAPTPTANFGSESFDHEPSGGDIEESFTYGNDESVLTGTGTGQSPDESSEKEILAKKETRAVLGLRLLVFAVLLLAAIAVCIIVFFVTSGSEEEEYKTQYEGAVKQIAEAFVGIVDTRLSAISSLGVAMIAHGRDHDSQFWPYVTLSSFQQRASTARKQSLALYIHVNPKVELDQREEWEHFVGTNPDSVWM